MNRKGCPDESTCDRQDRWVTAKKEADITFYRLEPCDIEAALILMRMRNA
jgi:hypothetical protein